MHLRPVILIVAGAMLSSTVAIANDKDAPPPKEDSKLEATGKRAGEIVTQPVRDVGLDKDDVPPVLQAARESPYATEGLKSCADYRKAISALNEVLGPDFISGAEAKENKAGKLAEAGGKTVINAFIPFRGLVREISGAAPAQRRLAAAETAGMARRGFLRGIYLQRNCKPVY